MSGELEFKAVLLGERELDVATVLAAAEAGLGLVAPPERVSLDARYHDDDRMRAGRWTLRARATDGAIVATVKGPGARDGGVERRLEIDVPLPELPAEGDPLPPAIAAALAGVLPEGCWPPRSHRVEVDRVHVDVLIPGGAAELAIDRGRVQAAGREARIAEIELELRRGEGAGLLRAARQLGESLGLRPGGLSKAARGLALRGLLADQPVGGSRPELLDALAWLDDRVALGEDLTGAREAVIEALVAGGVPEVLRELGPDSPGYAALLWEAWTG